MADPIDLGARVHELERLYEDALDRLRSKHLRLEAAQERVRMLEGVDAEDGPYPHERAYSNGYAKGRADERAAIVADIRKLRQGWVDLGGHAGEIKSYACDYVLGRISDGAHRAKDGNDE